MITVKIHRHGDFWEITIGGRQYVRYGWHWREAAFLRRAKIKYGIIVQRSEESKGSKFN